MHLSLEEGSEVRALLARHPDGVPREVMNAELRAAHFERVARACVHELRKLRPDALELLMIALYGSGSSEDIRFAHDELFKRATFAQDGTRRYRSIPVRYWAEGLTQLARFDLYPRQGLKEFDYVERLQLHALLAMARGHRGSARAVWEIIQRSESIGAPDLHGLLAWQLIQEGQISEGFSKVHATLEADFRNPYGRQAGHRLFQVLPRRQQIQVLDYRCGPSCIGVGVLEGQGLIMKEFDGRAFQTPARGAPPPPIVAVVFNGVLTRLPQRQLIAEFRRWEPGNFL